MTFQNQNPPKTRHKFSNDADVTFLHTSVYFPANINCEEDPKPSGCVTYSTDRAVFAQLKITHIYIGVQNAFILKARLDFQVRGAVDGKWEECQNVGKCEGTTGSSILFDTTT